MTINVTDWANFNGAYNTLLLSFKNWDLNNPLTTEDVASAVRGLAEAATPLLTESKTLNAVANVLGVQDSINGLASDLTAYANATANSDIVRESSAMLGMLADASGAIAGVSALAMIPNLVTGDLPASAFLGANTVLFGGISDIASIARFQFDQAVNPQSAGTIFSNTVQNIKALINNNGAGTTASSDYLYNSSTGAISFYNPSLSGVSNVQYLLNSNSGPVCTTSDPTGSHNLIANGQALKYTASTSPNISQDSNGNVSITFSQAASWLSAAAGAQTTPYNIQGATGALIDPFGNMTFTAPSSSGTTDKLVISANGNAQVQTANGMIGTSLLGPIASGNQVQISLGSNNQITFSDVASGGHVNNNVTINPDNSYSVTTKASEGQVVDNYNSTNQILNSVVTFSDGSGKSVTTYSNDPNSNWSMQIAGYNNSNKLVATYTTFSDGSTKAVTVDPATNLPTLTVTRDNQGNVSQITQGSGTTYNQYVQAIGDTLASQVISNFLFRNNLPASIAATAFVTASIKSVTTPAGQPINFSQDVTTSIFDAAGSVVLSKNISAVAKALGLPTEAGQLVSGVTSNLLTQSIVQDIGLKLNLTLQADAKDILTVANFQNALAGAGGTMLAGVLDNLITPTNLGGAITGAVATTAALLAFTNPVTPFLEVFAIAFGSDFIGTLLGDLLGGLFGGGYRGVPFVQAGVGVSNGKFVELEVSEDNNGNINDAHSISKALTGYLNQILTSVGGTATSSASWNVGYGGMGDFSIQLGQWGPSGSQIFGSVNDAIKDAAFHLLKSVQITGGSPIMMWELQTSTATTMDGLLSDLGIAQNYQLFSSNPLAVAGAIVSGNAATFQNYQTQLAAAQNKGLGRLAYNGTTLTINTTAAQLAGDLMTLSHMQGTAYAFSFADTAANTVANLSALQAQAAAGHLKSISFTDATTPTLAFSAVQIANNLSALQKLTGSYLLNVTDTAANVVANLNALQTFAAGSHLNSLVLTDTGTPTMTISAVQSTADAGALAKITSGYKVIVQDTAANISANFASLQALQVAGRLTSITATDSSNPVLGISYAQYTQGTATLALMTTPYLLGLVDAGANVGANLAALQTLVNSGKLVSVKFTDTTKPALSISVAQTTSYASLLALMAGNATLNVTGIVANTSYTINGNGFTLPLAIGSTVQSNGTNSFADTLNGSNLVVTLTNSRAVVDAAGNVTFTTPLAGFGSSILSLAANGTTVFNVGSDNLSFQGNVLRTLSYANSVFNFGVAASYGTYTEMVTWNPATGLANLVLTATGGQPVTTSLGQVNPGTAFIVSGSTITNTNSSGQKLLSTTVNADGSQINTVYNYSGGVNKDTVTTLNAAGQQTAIRWDHTDGSSYTTFTNPTTQAVIANLTINADGSGSISTANNQTVTFAAGNIASSSVGVTNDVLLTLKTLSGKGITETLDMSSGQIVTKANGNTLTYTLANAGATVDASGNVTITGGGSTLVLPANGSAATFTVGQAVLPFPQTSLQAVSSVNGVYQFGLITQASGFVETLTWNPTTGAMNLYSVPPGSSATITSLGLFNPGNVFSISGSTISITANGTVASTTTINADGSQSNTFNNGAGALHVGTDGTTVFIYGNDQLTFKPNMLLSSSSANGTFTFNIKTPSSAYTESITWNPTNGMANLVLTASGKSPVTTSLGQVNPGTVFMVSGTTISNTNSAGQLLQSTTINADGSQVGTVYSFSGNAKDTITSLNNIGQQTSIRWDNTDGSSYTSYTNPTTQAAIANFSVNANGSGYVATNNNQTVNFAAGNLTSVAIGVAGDTILSIKTASGIVETLDMSSGKIVSTLNGKTLTYTLANAGASIDASGNVTITGGGSTIVIPANGGNALFTVGQDSLSFPQSALQTLSSTSGVYTFGVVSTVTGYNESINWNPTNGMASLVLTPTAGGTALTTTIGQINPGNVLTLAGNSITITGSGGAAITTTAINSDGSQMNIFYNNTATVKETVTTINAAGKTTSVRWDNVDGSAYTSYYTPGTTTVVANRSVNANGSGYVATANNHTVNFAAGNEFTVTLDGAGNPLISITNLTGSVATQTLDVLASQLVTTINGVSMTYSLPTPSINYDGSGNLTLVASGSTLVLPSSGSAYTFSVGQDTISLDPASLISVTPNGSAYNFNLKSQAGTGTSEYVTWSAQTGIATLNMVATNGTTTSTNMGWINPGYVMKISSSIITNTNATGQVINSYAVETNGTVVSTALNGSTTYAASNSLLGLATGVTASVTGSNDTIYASSGDTITNAGNAANTYKYGSGFGTQVLNNAGTTSGNAKGLMEFLSSITDQSLWLKQSGSNLEVDLLGTTSKVTINGWFTNASSQLATIQTDGDGMKLDSQVAQLVSAMASYASSHSGFNPATAGTVMPTDMALQTAITTAWHH